jgi:uncharacterized protein YndB with AHSA1/START domain
LSSRERLAREKVTGSNRRERHMLKLEKKVTIKAPIEKVFGFVEKPEYLPQIWPAVYEVKEIERIPTGGHRFVWLYNMVGHPMKGTFETFKFESGKLIVDKLAGDLEGTFTWRFVGHDGITDVILEEELVPKKTLPKEELLFFERRKEFETEIVLENLKARLELV